MTGAGEYYYPIIKAGEAAGMTRLTEAGTIFYYNHLLFHLGYHARGKTLHIYVVDTDCTLEDIQNRSPFCIPKVEVYGHVSGQCGWNECYGWIESGPWERVVDEILNRCIEIYKLSCDETEKRKQLQRMNDLSNKKFLLDKYTTTYERKNDR